MNCVDRGHHRWTTVQSCIAEDLRRYLTKSEHDRARGDNWKTRVSACLTPEVLPVIGYRLAHYLYANGWRRLAFAASWFNQVLHRVHITPQSCIGSGFRLPHPAGVTFHGRAGDQLTMFSLAICCSTDHSWNGPVETGPLLGDSVTIAGHAVVQGPVAIGSGTTVAHGIQLHQDAPHGVLVVSKLLRYGVRKAEVQS